MAISKMGKIFFVTTLLLASETVSSSDLCEPWERNEIINPEIKTNNSMWDLDNELLYPPGTYWKDSNDSKAFYGCPCMLDKPCIRKCCEMNEAMDFNTLHCIPHEATWPWFQPNVSADIEYKFRTERVDYFGLIIGNYCRGYLLEPASYPEEDQFYINFTDGTLAMPQKNKSGLGVDRYCLEYIPLNRTYLPYVCLKQLGLKAPPPDLCDRWRLVLYPIGMSISVFFLILSFLVLVLLPDMRNMHGKCLMCHIASLIVAYIFLSIVQSIGHELRRNVCITYGFIVYFSLLCSFFWLNIMCIDISVAFSAMKPMRGSAKERDLKKFILYVSYAFGSPFIITAIAAFIELYPNIPPSIIKPYFIKTCWFFTPESRHAYFVAPVGVIILCNTILFILTAFNIWKIERETSLIHADNSKRHNNKDDKNRFNLYIKLSIVMGLSWAMEIISWLAGGSICYWMATDLFNTLQGVFIFIIFICKKKVKRQLITRYSSRWPILGSLMGSRSSEMPSASTSSSNVSSTANNMKMKKKPPPKSVSSVPD